VPYEHTHTPGDAELRLWEGKRRAFREGAVKAMTVREALGVIRDPRWRWC
jgi:hypothetical protein